MAINSNTPPSKGRPGGGGGGVGGGGLGAAKTFVSDNKNTAKMVIFLFGTIFIVRKSIKKI
jgi:hypothetical protein